MHAKPSAENFGWRVEFVCEVCVDEGCGERIGAGGTDADVASAPAGTGEWAESCAEIWAKLEFLNPGGSVKDRAALGLVLDAERRGVLRPGGTIVEATAGNTGVGLALIGVNRGYKVMLYVPEQFAEEKVKLMRGLGATVVRTPEAEGMAGAIERALRV